MTQEKLIEQIDMAVQAIKGHQLSAADEEEKLFRINELLHMIRQDIDWYFDSY